MNIWLINHYAVPPKYYPLARPSLVAKHLIKKGHHVTIISASTVHNSSQNLIEDKENVKKIIVDGITYILIKCTNYRGNGIKRIINIFEFANRLPRVLDTLEKPNVIIATSFDPISCYTGIKYAKENKIKAIAEIADLWPETLVAYNGVSPKNPLVKWLRKIEKKIYVESDSVVFTMEGAYDYIIEQGWNKEIPKEKVYYINNGIDLEEFDFNREHYCIEDEDLDNPHLYKVIYTGSIRRVNNLDKLLDIAKQVKNEKVRFLVWGDGEELQRLRQRIRDEEIHNVVFKGKVEKKYIPYITSKADLNFAHNESSPLFRFGISFNKIFDYLAAGRPILCDFESKYNPVLMGNAGLSTENGNASIVAAKIDEICMTGDMQYYSKNARLTAAKYDFANLTLEFLEVINSS